MKILKFSSVLDSIVNLQHWFMKYEFGSSKVIYRSKIIIEIPKDTLEVDMVSFLENFHFMSETPPSSQNFSVELPTGIVEIRYV